MDWQPIETAPIGEVVLLWHPLWRHAYPGVALDNHGSVHVDTLDPGPGGFLATARRWMPMPEPSKPVETVPGLDIEVRGGGEVVRSSSRTASPPAARPI